MRTAYYFLGTQNDISLGCILPYKLASNLIEVARFVFGKHQWCILLDNPPGEISAVLEENTRLKKAQRNLRF